MTMSTLENIAASIASCTNCPLHRSRRHAVAGEGPGDASLMFVGEAPGRQEDQHGRPFVGKAGRLLDHALAQAHIDRHQIFITNMVKCRPPNNRNPHKEEIAACSSFLTQQIRIIQPRTLCVMGRVAAEHILPWYGIEPLPLSRMHGRLFSVEGTIHYVVPLYHPAAIIYNPSLAEVLLADLKKITALNNQKN